MGKGRESTPSLVVGLWFICNRLKPMVPEEEKELLLDRDHPSHDGFDPEPGVNSPVVRYKR